MDEYDYNNGVPPVTGNVWLPADEDGPGRWVAPTSGSWNGDTLTVTPSGGSSAGQDGMAYGGGSYGKTPSRLQAESSAAIHATAKWSTENLKKTQAAQAERVRATMAAQQAAKASQDKLRQKLTDVTNAAIQKGREGPSVTDVAHQTIKDMEAFAQIVAQNEAVRRAEKEARKAEEAYQAALRAEEEARRQQAEIERKLKEAREREAAAKAKALADKAAAEKAEADRKALFAKAGIQDTPVYTPEMVKAANAMLAATGVAVLNRAPGQLQMTSVATKLSRVSSAVMTTSAELAGWMSGALWRGAVSVAETATVSTVGASVGAFVMGFWPFPAGDSSDSQVPGRDTDMLAAQARLFTAGKVNIEPGMKSANLPVRGFITTDETGNQSVTLVKTGTGGVSATVPVLNAVRDKTTGLDKITVPAVEGTPSRIILVNPVPVGPAAPSHTGNSTPVPVTPVHTGTEVKQADSIVTTTFPAADIPPLQDFIYWQPDASGTGVEPIYVMLAKPPVEFLEVDLYSNFRGRSRQRKYEADHMPSAAAVRKYLETNAPEMLSDDIDKAVLDVAAIVVPKEIHQKLSQTYGGRNQPAQISLDSRNLRAALDRNLDAIKPELKKHGATDAQLEAARSKMHKLNIEMGLYK